MTMTEWTRRQVLSATLAGACSATLFCARPSEAQSPGSMLLYKGADREQKVIEGAKKEGQVVIYAAMIVNQAMRPIAEGFQKKYPFIRLTYWRGDTEDIIEKVAAEVRANNNVADVIEGTGAGEEAARANVVQPYYSPALAAYRQQYFDPNGLWASTRISYYGAAYNTKLVSPADMPKTYEALLDPKWKGKIAWRVGTDSGTDLFITNLRLAWGDERALAYLEKLKGQDIINFGAGSARTLVDRVIAGEYPIALNIFAHHPLISKAKGAPVDTQLMDPVPSTASTMGITRGAAHPNAALLLIDYILSEEGQRILAQAGYFPADPSVPPLALQASVVPKTAGMHENFIGPDKLMKYTDSSEAIFRRLFR
jgi:ABC-type Fe3+ transport system substrate-binding protein